MRAPSDRYQRNLLLQLHYREVPGSRIGDVLAEVDSHVAETGDDPNETFGPPRQYAATIAPRRPSDRRRQLRIFMEVLAGGVAGWLLAVAVINLVQGHQTTYSLPTWSILTAGLVVSGFVITATRWSRERIIDPRTGEAMAPSQGVAFTIVVGAVLACVAVLALFLR